MKFITNETSNEKLRGVLGTIYGIALSGTIILYERKMISAAVTETVVDYILGSWILICVFFILNSRKRGFENFPKFIIHSIIWVVACVVIGEMILKILLPVASGVLDVFEAIYALHVKTYREMAWQGMLFEGILAAMLVYFNWEKIKNIFRKRT